MKQVGLFGGTFNPIHKGHLWAARAVREGFHLDSVILIPSLMPPHKPLKEVAPAADRMEMIRRSIEGDEYLSVSDVELVRSGPSYSIDTIRHFISRCREETIFYFIVGVDAFLEIDTWKSFRDLFGEVSMIVLNRPDSGPGGDRLFFEKIQGFLRARIADDYLATGDGRTFSSPHRPPVFLFTGEMKDISSTLIRKRIGRGESISDVVPPCADDYIRRKGLYQ